MAIEIKELIVKMNINEGSNTHYHSNTISSSPKLTTAEKNAIVKECIEKVLDKLSTKLER